MKLKVSYGKNYEHEFVIDFNSEAFNEIKLVQVSLNLEGKGGPDWVYWVRQYALKTA